MSVLARIYGGEEEDAPPMPIRGTEPQSTAPTAQADEAPEDVMLRQGKLTRAKELTDATVGELTRAANNTASVLGAMTGAAPVAKGAGAVTGWLGRIVSAGRAGGPVAAGQAAGPALAASAPLVEGVVLGEKAPISGAGAIQAAEAATMPAAAKALSAAERRMAENVAGRAEALAAQRADLAPLRAETQPGMSGFVARREGEIAAEQTARGLDAAPVEGGAERLVARPSGHGQDEAGEYWRRMRSPPVLTEGPAKKVLDVLTAAGEVFTGGATQATNSRNRFRDFERVARAKGYSGKEIRALWMSRGDWAFPGADLSRLPAAKGTGQRGAALEAPPPESPLPAALREGLEAGPVKAELPAPIREALAADTAVLPPGVKPVSQRTSLQDWLDAINAGDSTPAPHDIPQEWKAPIIDARIARRDRGLTSMTPEQSDALQRRMDEIDATRGRITMDDLERDERKYVLGGGWDADLNDAAAAEAERIASERAGLLRAQQGFDEAIGRRDVEGALLTPAAKPGPDRPLVPRKPISSSMEYAVRSPEAPQGPFFPGNDTLRPAKYEPRPGERGAALNPIPAGVEAIVDAAPRVEAAAGRAFDTVAEKARPAGALADRTAGVLGFRYNDPLSQFEGQGGVGLDTTLARTRNAQMGGTHTAAETARALQTDFKPWESAAINRYLTAKNELQMARQGLPVPDRPVLDHLGAPVLDPATRAPQMRPTTEADLLQDIATAEQRFMFNDTPVGPTPINSKQRLQHEEGKYRDWMQQVRLRLKDAGEEVADNLDYTPRMVEDFYQEGENVLGRRAPGTPAVNATKERIGSTRSAVENPYQTGAVADYQSRRLAAAKDFERDVLYGNDLTEQVTSGAVKFDPEKHALFSFARGDKGREVLLGAHAENALKHGIGNHRVLPKLLVEGLDKALQPAGKASILDTILTPGARLAKNTQLMLSPTFQSGQWVADYMTHLANLKVREWPEFTRQVAKNVPELARAYLGSLGVGKAGYVAPKLLEKQRELGRITDVVENLFDRAPRETPSLVPERARGAWEQLFGGASVSKVVSDKSLPLHLREVKAGDIPGMLWEEFRDAMGAVGQVRETAFKKAHAEVLKQRGVSEEAATAWANRISGNYWKSTDNGRAAGKIALFSKWYAEQVTRLTRDIAKNPMTGRSDWEGLTSGPAPKIAATALLTYIVNNRNDKVRKAADNLSSRDMTGIVLDVNEKGDPLVMSPDSLDKVAAAGGWYAKELLSGNIAGAFKEFGNTVTSRATANPMLRVGLLPWRDTPRDERDLTTEEKAAQVARKGGYMGSPEGQVVADALTGAPGRAIKALRAENTSDKELGIARVLGLMPGVPVFRRDSKDRIAEERARDGGAMWQQFIDNARALKPTAETIKKAREAAVWLQKHGITEQGLKSTIRRGAKNAAEAERMTREEGTDALRRYMRAD